MIRTLDDVNHYLSTLTIHRERPEERLETVREVLAELNNPQNDIPAIHIAGTSGKGSTAYYTAALLQAAGYSVGLAVSPHVHSVRERSQVNGAPLPETPYCTHFNTFVTLTEEHGWKLSYIEFLVVFTFWLFKQLQLEYIVIEVGMGGRLDPTNALTTPETIRVITDIGLDHTEILGDTLEKIAREKAGIIHTGDTVFVHTQPTEVLEVFTQTCKNLNAHLTIVERDTIEGSPLPQFQQRNWTLARAAVEARLTHDKQPPLDTQAYAASQSITIPGRYERHMVGTLPIILDVAHNPQKISALMESFRAEYPDTKAVFVVAFGNNKEHTLRDSLTALAASAQTIFLTTFTVATEHRTALPPEHLAAYISEVRNVPTHIEADPFKAFAQAQRLAHTNNMPIIVTGSFYLIDGIRELLLRSSEEIKK